MTIQITPWILSRYFHSALTAIATYVLIRYIESFVISIYMLRYLCGKTQDTDRKREQFTIPFTGLIETARTQFRSDFSTPKQGQISYQYMSANNFRSKAPRSPDFSPLYFYLWGHLKYPCFIQLHLKMQRHYTNALLRRVKPFPTASRPLKFATVHEQIYPCAYWFKWRTSGTFFVNCDFIKHENSTVIKCGTCIINILSLDSKILHSEGIYFWMQSLNSKTTHFGTKFIQNFLRVHVKNSRLKFVPAC